MILKTSGEIDQTQSTYPVWAKKIESVFTSTQDLRFGSVYVYLHQGGKFSSEAGDIQFGSPFVFSAPIANQNFTIHPNTWGVVIFRYGVKSQLSLTAFTPGEKGRLSYVDGCSDTILLYPPRYGDPSFNYLYFPPQTEQSFHTHSSLRIGCVVDGSGFAELNQRKEELSVGSFFCLEEHERHRFLTTSGTQMTVLAFHPDGDWGPTDQSHIMINRTLISGKQ